MLLLLKDQRLFLLLPQLLPVFPAPPTSLREVPGKFGFHRRAQDLSQQDLAKGRTEQGHTRRDQGFGGLRGGPGKQFCSRGRRRVHRWVGNPE